MKKLFTDTEFENAKSRDLLKCECYVCNTAFLKQKRIIKHAMDHDQPGPKYCSSKCQYEAKTTGNIVNCTKCNKKIYRNKKWLESSEHHFCSKSCAATFNNTGQSKSDKTKRKIAEKLKGRTYPNRSIIESSSIKTPLLHEKTCINSNCNKKYKTKKKTQKYCSPYCAKTCIKVSRKISQKVKQRVASGQHKGWQSRNIRSYPELYFEQVLTNEGIKFESEYKIKKQDLGLDCPMNYFLDFYLPDYNLDLEIDGKHHKQPDIMQKDMERDEALTQAGYFVYRIPWSNPNGDELKTEIEKFKKYLDL